MSLISSLYTFTYVLYNFFIHYISLYFSLLYNCFNFYNCKKKILIYGSQPFFKCVLTFLTLLIFCIILELGFLQLPTVFQLGSSFNTPVVYNGVLVLISSLCRISRSTREAIRTFSGPSWGCTKHCQVCMAF